MKITFYDNHQTLAYNPETEYEIGVGGTETVIIEVAKALVQLGHQVSVYINCDKPNIYNGVNYYHFKDYKLNKNNFAINEDVFIGFETFPEDVKANKIINWTNRAEGQPILKYPHIDHIISVSEYHQNFFKQILPPELFKKISVISLGVDPIFFEEVEKKPKSIIYAGHPGKGGMNWLPEVKKQLPEYSIDVYGSGNLWGENNNYEYIYQSLKEANINYKGQVGKINLAKALNEAEIFLYPVEHHHIETFCLVVLEAMAAGCYVIASDSGNIFNLIKNYGSIIRGDKYDFADIATKTIKELQFIDKFSIRNYAREFTWLNTAKQLERIILYG